MYLRDSHLVGGECASLVGAYDGGAPQRFDRGKTSNNSVLLSHPPSAKGEARCDDRRQSFRDGGDSEGDGDLEVIDGASEPAPTMCSVREVTQVDQPHYHTDHRDHVRQLRPKLVQLLLEWRLLLLRLLDVRVDLPYLRVQPRRMHHRTTLACCYVGPLLIHKSFGIIEDIEDI